MMLHCGLMTVFLWCIILAGCHVYIGHVVNIGMCFALLWGLWSGYKKKLSVADAVMAMAMLMNLWYVEQSWGNIRQHDYYNFVMFADYFVSNHFFIAPPVTYLQSVFYHPPVWGFITGLFMQFLEFDAVRFISLFSIGGAYILIWRLLTTLQIRDNLKLWLWAFFCFYPVHGLMSNWVNNDALVYFLMIALVYAGFVWYKNSSWKQSWVIFGLFILAGMTKFSGLMIAPVIGILMLFKLMNTKNKLDGHLWGKFMLIGLGCILGFAWGLFLLYFHFPLLPPPQDVAVQSMTRYALSERIFDFSGLFTPIVDFKGLYQTEPNVWLTLIKTSLFGEWGWQGQIWIYTLYVLAFIWLILSTIGFIYLFFKPMGKDFAFNGALIVLFFGVLIAWINFWLDYPYFCSTEFRYTAIFLPASVLWVGYYLNQKSLPKYVNYTLAGGVFLMIIARFMLYLNTI